MDSLKLLAVDAEDLQVISAYLQDSVLKTGDIALEAGGKRVVLAMNRYVWEKRRRFFKPFGERRRSVLHFDRVLSVRTNGIDRSKPDEVLNLLAIGFKPGEEPAGTVEIDVRVGDRLTRGGLQRNREGRRAHRLVPGIDDGAEDRRVIGGERKLVPAAAVVVAIL